MRHTNNNFEQWQAVATALMGIFRIYLNNGPTLSNFPAATVLQPQDKGTHIPLSLELSLSLQDVVHATFAQLLRNCIELGPTFKALILSTLSW